MGVGVSGWRLAQAVSKRGHLGVVAGTALDVMLARRLQNGDPGGHMAWAIAHFPYVEIARRVWEQYFLAKGKRAVQPFKPVPMHSLNPPRALVELTVLASFVEVLLAKSGHHGVVGINQLAKIQFPTLPSLFGAMLAGVDYVLMGAGIPRAIPGVLDGLAAGEAVQLKVEVEEAGGDDEWTMQFDPQDFCGGRPVLKRPRFLPIISSATLAIALVKKSSGRVDGFVVEGSLAGGHNAPPRGGVQLSEQGEPIYGEKDVADLDKIKALGLPFWLAGNFAGPEKLREAEQLGAAGVQVGTAFAFSDESGIEPGIKRRVLEGVWNGTAEVFTDPLASPTGYPFKVVRHVDGTVTELSAMEPRNRTCDLGYLRHAYKKEDGSLGYRCPAEPVESFVRKGGHAEDTLGRVCLCNGLLATAGLPQWHEGSGVEPPIVTAGDFLLQLKHFLAKEKLHYSAHEVIDWLLSAADPEMVTT